LLTGCSAPVAGTAAVGTPSADPTGRSTPGSATPDIATPDTATPGSATGEAPIPAGLETFYRQRLDWGSCAELATSEATKF
jgi:hypothetical protein